MNAFPDHEKLKRFDLFNNISDTAIEDVSSYLTARSYKTGDTIIRQGEHGDTIYFLLSGKCKAYIIDKHGNEIKLSTIYPNQSFGEIALLSAGARTCYIEATEPCELFCLTQSNLKLLLSKHHTLSLALNNILASRLRETLQVISEPSDNEIILLTYSPDNTHTLESFISHFKTTCKKQLVIIDSTMTNSEFTKLYSSIKNHIILIRHKQDSQLLISGEIIKLRINFVDKSDSDIYLPKSSSDWMIGRTVRKILHKQIGIALCSGGAPAAAHIGVLKALQRSGIPIDYIAGTSAGAIFGACAAFNIDPHNLLSDIIKLSKTNKLKLFFKYHGKVSQGLLNEAILNQMLSHYFLSEKIEDASIPFAAVASDLLTGKTIILDRGPVIDALISSNSAPVLFQPIKHHDHLLIDGVATSPLPIKVLFDQNIDIKIAVPIPQLDLATTMNHSPKILPIFLRSRSMMANEIVKSTTELADVIIEPIVNDINADDWSHSDSVIEEGEKAASLAIARIKLLFNTS